MNQGKGAYRGDKDGIRLDGIWLPQFTQNRPMYVRSKRMSTVSPMYRKLMLESIARNSRCDGTVRMPCGIEEKLPERRDSNAPSQSAWRMLDVRTISTHSYHTHLMRRPRGLSMRSRRITAI